MIFFHAFFQRPEHLARVFRLLHVDEIYDDDAAEVAQAQLLGYGLGRFQVGLVYGFLQVPVAYERARINVYGRHGLGLVYDKMPAGLQLYLAFQGFLQFILDGIQVHDRPLTGVVFDPAQEIGNEMFAELHDPLVGFLGVDTYFFNLAVGQVPHGPNHQGQVLVDQRRRVGVFCANGYGTPELEQEVHVPVQFVFLGALRGGPDDETAPGRFRFDGMQHRSAAACAQGDLLLLGLVVGNDPAQAFPLRFILYPLGDPDNGVVGNEHEVAGRNGDTGGEPCALGADRVLDHLHQELLAFGQQGIDRILRERAGNGLHLQVFLGFDQVRDVQEPGAFQADIDERRLHARQYPVHAPLDDISDQAAFAGPFDMDVLQHAVLHHGDAGLVGSDVYEDLFAHEFRTTVRSGG